MKEKTKSDIWLCGWVFTVALIMDIKSALPNSFWGRFIGVVLFGTILAIGWLIARWRARIESEGTLPLD